MRDKHTQEPWRAADNAGIYDATGAKIGEAYGHTHNGERQANARRIAACVNALAGVPTGDLEGLAGGTLDGALLDREAAVLCRAAPDLLAALTELLAAYEDGTVCCHCSNSGQMAPAPCVACRSRAAIKKARGEDA